MTIPTLQTPRLVLRAFTEEDVDPMHQILSGEGVLRYFPPTDPLPRDRVHKMVLGLLRHWDERGYGLWAVESRPEGELMGRCGLQYLAELDEVEIDFILGRPFWGQGFGTEAARASVCHGFEELGLERVVGIVHVENRASQGVLEKLGMALVEQREFFGIPCYHYAVERPAFDRVSVSWKSGT
jgi:ribosomal-protein-alanine N-acetyltransferase